MDAHEDGITCYTVFDNDRRLVTGSCEAKTLPIWSFKKEQQRKDAFVIIIPWRDINPSFVLLQRRTLITVD